jgi:hypothetical protein
MIVGMELCYGDLHAAADSKTQSLSDLKHAENNPGCQECLPFARVWAIQIESGILLNHRPNFALDAVLEGRVPQERAAQNVRAACRETSAKGVLDAEWAPDPWRGLAWEKALCVPNHSVDRTPRTCYSVIYGCAQRWHLVIAAL